MRLLPLLLSLAGLCAAKGGLSLTGYVGGSTPWSDMDAMPSWSVHSLWRIDQMVSAGVGGGYMALPGTDVAEASSRLQVRLPIGRQLMPFLEGEAGAGLRPVLTESIFIWRFGGGLDLKLGDKSSLLFGMGSQTRDRAYGRIGLLLEL